MAKTQKNINERKTSACKDEHCATHNSLKIRGRTFTGTVIQAKAQKTATVEWGRKYYLPKYERYEKRRTRIKAHNPDCISAKKGEIVKIAECRPLSKTKHFVITEKVGQNITFMEKQEQLEEAKIQQEKSEKNESN